MLLTGLVLWNPPNILPVYPWGFV